LSEVFVDQRKVPVEKAGGSGGGVDGESIEAGWTSYSFNVAGTKTDEEFFLSIRYDQKQAEFFDSWFGSTEAILLPQIGGVASGEREVVTQELRAVVFVPREYKLVGVPEGFVILREPYGRLEPWFDSQKRTSNLGSLPVQGRPFVYGNLGGSQTLAATWWETSSMAAGISIPIFAIGCVLLWTPWSNRLSVVLVGMFVVSLLSLSYADSVAEALLAGRWGIGFGVATWMLAAVIGFQRSTDFSSIFGSVAGKVLGVLKSDKASSPDESDNLAEDQSSDEPGYEPAVVEDGSTGEGAEEVESADEVDGEDSDTGGSDEAGESDETDQKESRP
jgi:hypothetical protein